MIYKIIGTYRGGEEVAEFGLWTTREFAEQHIPIEIEAYTYKGVCDWEFTIEEKEVYE